MVTANGGERAMKRTIASLALILALVYVPLVEANSLTGRQWMAWDESDRAIYVMGYWHGLNFVMRAVGGEFRIKAGVTLTYEDAARMVYRKLLWEPELRSGDMADIISAVLAPYIVLTDSQGRRLTKD